MTPMMEQYFEIKNNYKDYILFYRLGDFYEMFFDDAVLASRELELTLTGRDCGEAERAPMCGVPFHSSESYIGKLIERGYKVAICEQTYDAIQVFGGSGVIEDFPVARLYRDARVTTIYEGTSQMQVIAAARYISNGQLSAIIRERIDTISECDIALRFTRLVNEFERSVAYCTERGNEFLTLHQRRLVEMGGHILMAYLLYTERETDPRAKLSFSNYITLADGWSAERLRRIGVE